MFWERLELQYFPFDVQELSIIIASKLTTDDVKLISDKKKGRIGFKTRHTFVEQQKWFYFKQK